VQLNFLKSSIIVVILGALGCVSPAPDLPVDYGSINAPNKLNEEQFQASDLALECDKIIDQLKSTEKQLDEVNSAILQSRDDEQTIGMVANLLFTPMWLLIDNNGDLKVVKGDLQDRIDSLILLSRFKSCL
jgi:hypothetical protein